MAGSFRRGAAPPPPSTTAPHASSAASAAEGGSGRGTAGVSFELLNREVPHDRLIVAASVHGLREDAGIGGSSGNAATVGDSRRPPVYGDIQIGDARPVSSGKNGGETRRPQRKKGSEAAHSLELGRSILWAAADAAGSGGGGGSGEEPHVVHLQLTHAEQEDPKSKGARGAADTLSVRGMVALRVGQRARLYLLRGYVAGGRRLRAMLVPHGLEHLMSATKKHLPSGRVLPAFLAASYAVLKYARNETLAVACAGDAAAGRPRHRFDDAAIRPDPGVSDKMWTLTNAAVSRDSCVWYGDFELDSSVRGPAQAQRLGLIEHGRAEGVGEGAYYGVSGAMTSLTCNTTYEVSASQYWFAGEVDEALSYLLFGMLASLVHVYGLLTQVSQASTRSVQSRLNWVSFTLLGISEWWLFCAHWSILSTLPHLLRPVLAICFVHGCTMHLSAQLALLSLEATPLGMLERVVLPPLLTFPINFFLWATENRVQYMWIPATLMMNSVWVPQIAHSTRHRTQQPASVYVNKNCKRYLSPSHTHTHTRRVLVATTFVSRLYFLHRELMGQSFLKPFGPHAGLYAAVSAWLGLQTVIVLLQHWCGPTFFLPSSWSPAKGFDYHRPLPPSLQHAADARGGAGGAEAAAAATAAHGDAGTARRRSTSAVVSDLEESRNGGDRITIAMPNDPADLSPGSEASLDCVICQVSARPFFP